MDNANQIKKSTKKAIVGKKKRGTRRPKTNRVPCTRAGNTWTNSAYWGFIRALLRQGSKRWPPIACQALNDVRRTYQGPNKRQKWEYQCAGCGDWYKRDDVQVDHIEPCGQLKCEADIQGFVTRLFCEKDKLRILCTGCHTIITRIKR